MRGTLAALAVLTLTGCAGSSLSEADKAERCATFATTVAKADLQAGTPDEQTAKAVAEALDPQLARLSTPALHDPAVRVHQALHTVESAVRRGDTAQADEAADKARAQLEALATACGLPAADFLGASSS